MVHLTMVAVLIVAPLVLAQPQTAVKIHSSQSRQLQHLNTVDAWPASRSVGRWLLVSINTLTPRLQLWVGQLTTLQLADALIRYAGFPSDQVILLASDQPPERQPTRGNILRRLSNLASVVRADGLLFVSFAGHPQTIIECVWKSREISFVYLWTINPPLIFTDANVLTSGGFGLFNHLRQGKSFHRSS